MLVTILLIVFAIPRIEHYPPVREHVNLIELNHVYHPNGSTKLSQFIYKRFKKTWTINSFTGEKEYRWGSEVVDWRYLKDAKLPIKNWRIKKFQQKFYDKKMGCNREITASYFIETHTYYDVEVEARECLPIGNRELLARPIRISNEKN